MEALVLCPEELCLGPVRLSPLLGISPPPAELSIWTSDSLEKGSRFLPWKGTVRSDKLPVFEKLAEFDVSCHFYIKVQGLKLTFCISGSKSIRPLR